MGGGGQCSECGSAICPDGTACRFDENGDPFCFDCECGFCKGAPSGESCCEINSAGNNCKAVGMASECQLGSDVWPGQTGTGNVCSGVEVSSTATPNGCGCQPSDVAPCTYTPTMDPEEKCFLCRAEDIQPDMTGTTGSATNSDCDACLSCLRTNMICDTMTAQNDNDCLVDWTGMQNIVDCIGDLSDDCREACGTACLKM